MSVATRADEQLDKTRKCVSGAIECLADIVVSECDGAKSFTDLFRIEMRSQLMELMRIRDKLK